jgi:hypothetical protein
MTPGAEPPPKLPPSCLGPDGKFQRMTEEERRQSLESARRRLLEIAEVPNGPDDPPDEEWMRGIDEMRPHRPLFRDTIVTSLLSKTLRRGPRFL